MTFLYDIPDNEKTAVPASAASRRACESFAGAADREGDAFPTEKCSWILPAILCLLLTAGSFYYYHQKIARESRIELKAIRADASLRRAYLTALQEQARFQEQQLATSDTEKDAIPLLE